MVSVRCSLLSMQTYVLLTSAFPIPYHFSPTSDATQAVNPVVTRTITGEGAVTINIYGNNTKVELVEEKTQTPPSRRSLNLGVGGSESNTEAAYERISTPELVEYPPVRRHGESRRYSISPPEMVANNKDNNLHPITRRSNGTETAATKILVPDGVGAGAELLSETQTLNRTSVTSASSDSSSSSPSVEKLLELQQLDQDETSQDTTIQFKIFGLSTLVLDMSHH
ncbi:uncharacterized protein BCR38DRAFT_482380 [Pseudomassariella vexata]|uniref:Uncharacterized protein n=1 Tax=Pseudomassariella vexata TaxID=1141098 RepID=A0A1Y2EBF7_9PEZI|nr:uncharacterized protein BCR38DRAFT_482380 [Pseudomassariella vexata]ORY68909.1 hypothetical protein BCR38DRAFT_482380 [Pseudomassariella vexata]